MAPWRSGMEHLIATGRPSCKWCGADSTQAPGLLIMEARNKLSLAPLPAHLRVHSRSR